MISTEIRRKESKEVKGKVRYRANTGVRCGLSLANSAPRENGKCVKRFVEGGGKIIYEEQPKIEGYADSRTSAAPGSHDARYRIELGKRGEKAAEAYLEERGWRIIERNWRAGRRGEIDLIARDPANCLVFIEVKARRVRTASANSDGYHTGFESVQGLKQTKNHRLGSQILESLRTKPVGCSMPLRRTCRSIWHGAAKPSKFSNRNQTRGRSCRRRIRQHRLELNSGHQPERQTARSRLSC